MIKLLEQGYLEYNHEPAIYLVCWLAKATWHV